MRATLPFPAGRGRTQIGTTPFPSYVQIGQGAAPPIVAHNPGPVLQVRASSPSMRRLGSPPQSPVGTPGIPLQAPRPPTQHHTPVAASPVPVTGASLTTASWASLPPPSPYEPVNAVQHHVVATPWPATHADAGTPRSVHFGDDHSPYRRLAATQQGSRAVSESPHREVRKNGAEDATGLEATIPNATAVAAATVAPRTARRHESPELGSTSAAPQAKGGSSQRASSRSAMNARATQQAQARAKAASSPSPRGRQGSVTRGSGDDLTSAQSPREARMAWGPEGRPGASPGRRCGSQAELGSLARRAGALTSREGGEDVGVSSRTLRQEVDELRQENARLQDKLCKAKSLVVVLQRQAEEARNERDREHKRAESLQQQAQNLQKQLKRETARAHLLERTLSQAARGEQSTALNHVRQEAAADEDQEGTANAATAVPTTVASPNPAPQSAASSVSVSAALPGDSHHGPVPASAAAAAHAAVAAGQLGAGAHGPRSPRTHHAARSEGELVDGEAAGNSQHAAGLPNGSTTAACTGEHGVAEELRPWDESDRGDSRVAAVTSTPELNGMESAVNSQKSWEFVVQGQHDPAEQREFAPKVASCFPDDGLELSRGRGVAYVCTRGRRLDSTVPNQDDFLIARHKLAHDGHIALYGVFDGHGPAGHLCAAYVRGSLPESLFGQHTLLMKPEETLRQAFRQTQAGLLQQHFDTEVSGTTAALALVLNIPSASPDAARDAGGNPPSETWLFVAHVGDSRVVLASHREEDPAAFSVTALTRDHRPDDAGEAERVRKDGGDIRKLHRNSGAVRVFARDSDRPALALTRTLGASAAASCGVIPEPEVSAYRLRPGIDVLLVLGTDGLFEFCGNTEVAGRILKEGASSAVLEQICAHSRRLWAQSSYNETVDDITAIAVSLPNAKGRRTQSS